MSEDQNCKTGKSKMLIEKDSSGSSSQPPTSSSSPSTPNPEPVRITLTGSRRAVKKNDSNVASRQPGSGQRLEQCCFHQKLIRSDLCRHSDCLGTCYRY